MILPSRSDIKLSIFIYTSINFNSTHEKVHSYFYVYSFFLNNSDSEIWLDEQF